MRLYKYLAGFGLTLDLVACGGGGGSAGTPSGTTPGGGTNGGGTTGSGSTLASLDILPTASTLGSAPGSSISFIVTAKDSANAAVPAQAVVFSATSGTLTGANPVPVTDANGTITSVSLSAGADATNRSITVTASAGNVTKSIVVPVVGTTLNISGVGSALVGNPALTFTVKAVDSGGKAVAGANVKIKSANGNTLSPQDAVTNLAGTAAFSFTPTIAGIDTLTVEGLGAIAKSTVAVSNEDFAFTTPLPAANLVVNTTNTVSVQYKVGGAGVPGQTVTFSTTRGALTALTAVTNGSGVATTSVSSTTAGPVTISAQLGTARSSVTAAFIATVPNTLVLQANPSAVLPNPSGSTANQSTLSATVRDATGNPVANQVVNFTATKDGSNGTITPGSGITNADGQTSVQFIPGALTTASNGIEVKATVQSATSVSGNATLTVNGDALFISIGVGNTLTSLDASTYQKEFSVYVTDANGAVAANRSVVISVYPTFYRKGFLEWVKTSGGGGYWQYEFGSLSLPIGNEDLNRNGILDLLPTTEDVNGNGFLDPGMPVLISPTTLTTDANGYAVFKLRYGKNYAWWVSTEITARSLVGGTESSKTIPHDLGMLIDDVNSAATPANSVSPYGK